MRNLNNLYFKGAISFKSCTFFLVLKLTLTYAKLALIHSRHAVSMPNLP